MEETADSAGESAEQLEGFSNRFSGAMTAAVSALAVGAAGLLSSVPVVGEAFSGLRAIVDQLILKIDKDLRPTLSQLTTDLFGVATDVGEAEGSLEGLVVGIRGVNRAVDDMAVDTLRQEIKSLTGITIPDNWLDFGWDVITMDARGAQQDFKEIIKNFPEDFDTFWTSMEDTSQRVFNNISNDISNTISDLTSDARQWGTNIINRFLGGLDARVDSVVEGFQNLSGGLSEWASNLASDAYDWGSGLIQRFLSGIRDKLDQFSGFLDEIEATIGVDIPDAPAAGAIGGAALGGTAGTALGKATGSLFGGGGGGREGRGGTTIDGRQLEESTGRYRSDPARRRGL